MIIRLVSKAYEGQVVLIFANIRTGKTTLLTRIAQKELKIRDRYNTGKWYWKKLYKKRLVYQEIISNTPISGVRYYPNLRRLFQNNKAPEHTLFLIDEGYLVWPNRKTKGIDMITDEEIEYIKLIGHYDSKMIIVSQSYEDIDIIIRRIYTSMFLLTKLGDITFIKAIKKFIDIDKETNQIVDSYKFRNIFSLRMLYRPKYYKYFDTKWKPDGRSHPNFSSYFIVPYPEKMKRKIKNLQKNDGCCTDPD